MRARPTLLATLLVSCALLGLPACGGGGGGGVSTPAPGGSGAALAITTTTLPSGTPGQTYPTTQLQAANVTGTATWSLASGSLPPGLSLDPDGVLAGTPSAEGSYPFDVRVDDDDEMDTQSLSIAVGALGLAAADGLTAGDAWTQRPVTLTTSGQTGSITFSIVANASGGSLGAQDPVAGTAVWTPGVTGGSGTTDRLRATDAGNGSSATLDLAVMPNPTDTHAASFGTTDVWYIDPSPKDGTHAFTSDFHKALADTGLRDPASTGAVGTVADELAATWIRVEILRQLNPMFLRERDGSAGTGLAISFPFEEPGPGYTKASPGTAIAGSPTRYSVLALIKGSTNGVIGTAFLDGANNDSHENDTTLGTLELGVFTNQITPIFNNSYGNPLPLAPVGSLDIPALKALLYDGPNPGGRYATLAAIGRGLARTLAAVIAHEAGHSLSLDHTNPPESGSIMNPSAQIGPTANYAFTAEDVTALQAALPGAGKGTGAQGSQKATAQAPGGVRVCNCRAHGAAHTAAGR